MSKVFYKGQKVTVNISYGITHEGIIEKEDSGYPHFDKSMVKVSGIGDPVSVESVELPEGWVSIPGLLDAAYRAHHGTSFSPKRRAQSCVTDYELELNSDLQSMPESERGRYSEGYKKHLFAWLSAKSRCLSSMITGPANFPVRRNEKALNSEHNRSVEFTEWREKAIKSIRRKIENDKPEAQKNAERWDKIRKGLERSMTTIVEIDNGINTYSARQLFVSSITGVVKTLAKNADTEMLERSLMLIKEWNEKANKPIITEKNSIWKLQEVCEANREKKVDREIAESNEYEVNGVKVVKNFQAERLQLFFDGKPPYETISSLKKAAFKWSPSNQCWQRQLTSNAVSAAERLLSSIQ